MGLFSLSLCGPLINFFDGVFFCARKATPVAMPPAWPQEFFI